MLRSCSCESRCSWRCRTPPSAALRTYARLARAGPPRSAARLRIHVSGAYASAPIGTHAQLRQIVHDADAVFASTVGAHFVIEEIVDGWKVDGTDTTAALRALSDEDPGTGVDV